MMKLTYPNGVVVEGQAKEIKEVLATSPTPKPIIKERIVKRYSAPTDGTKTCPKCGIEKHVTSFYVDKSLKAGRKSACNICTNKNAPREAQKVAVTFD